VDNKEKIEIAMAILHGTASREAARQTDPRQYEPSYFQKQKEKDGSMTWSGASGGGGTWAGRSR